MSRFKQDTTGIENEMLVQSKNYSKNYSGSLYRTHSYLDLLDLQFIRSALVKGDDFYINEDTILSTYEGHTIFSIFLEKAKVYDQIISQFKEGEFDDELNSVKKLCENSSLRRLFRILSLPTLDIKSKNDDVNCNVCI